MWEATLSPDLKEISGCLAGPLELRTPKVLPKLHILFQRLLLNLCLPLAFCRTAITQPTLKGYYEMISVKDPSQRLMELNFNFDSAKCEETSPCFNTLNLLLNSLLLYESEAQ